MPEGGIYGSGGTVSGGIYGSGTSFGAGAPREKKKKHGGGIFGTLKRIPGDFASDIYDAAVGTPAGLYYIGHAIGEDIAQDVRHPKRKHKRNVAKIGKAIGEATVEDLRHPLRNPGNTFLDILGAASLGAGTGARVGAASRAARAAEEGSRAGRAAKALVKKPKPKTRKVKIGDLELESPAARSALGRAGQRAVDKRLAKAAEKKPSGRAAKAQNKRAGKVLAEQGRVEERLHNSEAAALQAIGRKLKPAEQYALRVAAEETPLSQRILAQQEMLAASKGAQRSRHAKRLRLLEQARRHLVSDRGKPVLKSKKLQTVFTQMEKVAGGREQVARDLGLLTDEMIQGRKTAAGRVASGSEDFAASPEAVYVPDIEQKVGRSGAVSQVGAQGTIGKARNPIKYGYTGTAKRTASEPLKTTKAVAQSSLALSRYVRLHKLHGKLAKAASPVPRRSDDVAIRLDKLGPNKPLPKSARQFIDNPEELALLPEDAQAARFEKVRSKLIFGDEQSVASMTPEQLDEFRKLQEKGLVGWVPKALLGDLAKPHAPLQAVIGKAPVRVVDAVNDASKLAILYLKPAYAAPNIMGNAFLTLVQQGFAAPKNLARASRMQWKIGSDLTARVDTLMGEGFAHALRGESTSRLSGATHAAANVWGAAVDKPFRRASFLYEAGRDGFKTPAQLRKLLTDPASEPALIRVASRANRELIDYGRLSSREREIVRRIVFFYPWVKGSTFYAGSLLVNHPGKAASLGAVGSYGEERASDELGPHPSYLAGAFPTRFGLVNPAAAAIFQTPGQVGQTAASLLTGKTPDVGELSNFSTPALALLLNLAAGKNLSTGHEYPRSQRGVSQVAQDTLVGGLPQKRLLDAILGNSKAQLFPPSARSAIIQYLLGGIAPRPYDENRLRQLAEREQKELGG